MTDHVEAPSAVVWQWRKDPAAEAARRAAAIRSARVRGAIQGAVGLAVAALFGFGLHRTTFASVVASIAALVTLAALASPLGAYRVITGWVEKLGRAIGTLVTWILMPLFFFLLFLPFGFYLRARKRTGITLGTDPKLASYWLGTEDRPAGAATYERQF